MLLLVVLTCNSCNFGYLLRFDFVLFGCFVCLVIGCLCFGICFCVLLLFAGFFVL